MRLVTEITDHYISQHRTICLAVVSATNDYANQGILKKVRKVDPGGDRTLGIITKPDRLPSGSGSEKAFLGLARNEDIFFKLGWHMLKNRSYKKGSSSFKQRNISETSYFRTSSFSILSKEYVGITSLRDRLSQMLFEHIKQELPKLRKDLKEALTESRRLLQAIGSRRTTPQEYKAFLTQLSLDIYKVGKAAVNGYYEGEYFTSNSDYLFSVESPKTIRRLRAVIQYKNSQFSKVLRTYGYKYHFDEHEVDTGSHAIETVRRASVVTKPDVVPTGVKAGLTPPIHRSKRQAIEWVREALLRTRGRELPGDFNPLLVSELFWEQSSK